MSTFVFFCRAVLRVSACWYVPSRKVNRSAVLVFGFQTSSFLFPKTFPQRNFSRTYFFPLNFAETFFSKTFFGTFKENFSRKTLSQKLFRKETFPEHIFSRSTLRKLFFPKLFPATFRKYFFRKTTFPGKLHAKNFSQAKLFPGKNFSGQRCGNFFYQNIFRQLSANIFSSTKLSRENFTPKTFPQRNFFKNIFLQNKKTFFNFSKYFFTKRKPE